MSTGANTRRHAALVAAVLAALVAALIAVGVGINAVAGPSSASGVPTPTPAATPTPSRPATPVTFADCSTVSFGPSLAPDNPPANVHIYAAPPPQQIDVTKLYRATITTARGPFAICLQPSLAPATVNNFVALARNHFYDGLSFHRVVAGFIVQGGDPKGNGSGGPGYTFKDEPVKQRYVLGAVAMANSGPNTNGSQFFICTADDTTKLQPLYNLFGKVMSGLPVAQAIAQGDVMQTVVVAEQLL